MNIIFISPHFPQPCRQFCGRLTKNGANVLGIGSAALDARKHQSSGKPVCETDETRRTER